MSHAVAVVAVDQVLDDLQFAVTQGSEDLGKLLDTEADVSRLA
jgi:hypothetical protein